MPNRCDPLTDRSISKDWRTCSLRDVFRPAYWAAAASGKLGNIHVRLVIEEKHEVRLRAFIKEMDNGTRFVGNDNQASSCGNK